MVTFKGKLTLIRDSIDYGIYSGGLHRNISEEFNCNLLHKIKLRLRDNNKTLFNVSGVLRRVKQPNSKLYFYKVGTTVIDEILWNNVGNEVEMDWEVLKTY